MNVESKETKKLFNAPARMKNVLDCHNKPKDKGKSCTSTPVECKKNNRKKDTPSLKPTAKKIPRSLTDKEYDEIFRNVLDMSEAEVCPDDTKLDDEIEDVATHIVIDQWNQRAGDIPTQDKKKEIIKEIHTKKCEKKKKAILTDFQSKQQKKKCLEKSIATTTAKHSNQNQGVDSCVAETDQIESDKEETGTWIQCSSSSCGKWRYVADVSDPIEVPDYWDCSMNPDKAHSSCNAPEVDYDESEHILTKFTMGSVVWAKMDGYPWWPAMVDSDPDYDTYFELPSSTCMMPYLYHVTFFDERVSRAWVRSQVITPFDPKSRPKDQSLGKSYSTKKDLQLAVRNAETAFYLPLEERLEKFTFINRFSQSRKSVKSVDRKRNDGKRRRTFTPQKEDTIEKILTSSKSMLNELNIAIGTCDSLESDHCEEETSEDEVYVPVPKRKPRSSDASSVCTKSKEDQRMNISEQSSQARTDKDQRKRKKREAEFKSSSDRQICPKNMNFDPEIFTMELDSKMDDHENERVKGESLDLQDNNDNGKQNEKDNKASGLSKEGNLTYPTNKKLKSERGLTYEKLKKDDDEPETGNLKKKSKSKKYKEKNNKTNKCEILPPQVKIDSKELCSMECNSEKENRDPSIKKDEIQPIYSCTPKNKKKQKNKHLDLDTDEKQLLSVKANHHRNVDEKAKETGLEGSNKQKFKGTCRYVEIDDKEIKTMGRNSDKKKIKSDTVIEFNVTSVMNKQDATDKTCENELANIKDTTDSSKEESLTAMEEIEKEKLMSNKKKIKPKSFKNPIKDQKHLKSLDQSVPNSTLKSKKKESQENNSDQDQSVPDISTNLIDNTEAILLLENQESTETHVKAEKKQTLNEKDISDDEELVLSLDSLDSETQNIKDNIDFKDRRNMTNSSRIQTDQRRFGGHCSDHGSDSDPFELIEE